MTDHFDSLDIEALRKLAREQACKLEDCRVSFVEEQEARIRAHTDLSKIAFAHADNVWFWQGDGYDAPESLTCPIVMGADTLRKMLDETASLKLRITDLESGAEYRLMAENLRSAQADGTRLTDQVRSIRAVLLDALRQHDSFRMLVEDGKPTGLFAVILQLAGVRYRSDCKYKTVEHYVDMPDGTGGADAAAFLAIARDAVVRGRADGTIDWRKIMECEVAELFVETDPDLIEAEALDVANVATKWCQAIRMRRESRR